MKSRLWPLILIAAGFILSFAIPQYGLLDLYVQMILIYICINIILALSLNLVNGYMGEFSVGHAGFMSAGAYIASLITVKLFSTATAVWVLPLAIISGGTGAALLGLIVAIPSFRTRGDYLAIVTLAFNMIVKSVPKISITLAGPGGFSAWTS
jgi:branched-chain amino acid transport system permease protein